jgi:Mlc titration factor MtfA (ptsG expression regulator)
MLPFIRRRRRNRLMATPLPLSWWALIDTRVPAAARLSETERARLGGIVQILLNEKNFEGCAGLAMTDEIRLTIACQAALLVLNRPGDYYPGLYSILVYPAAYRAPTEEVGPLGIVTEDDEVRLGEAWTEGSVVLSWADVLRGARQEDDGRNVVIHEFAHLLDGQAGDMDGAPAPHPTPRRPRTGPVSSAGSTKNSSTMLNAADGPCSTPTAPPTPRSSSRSPASSSSSAPASSGAATRTCTQNCARFYAQDPAASGLSRP